MPKVIYKGAGTEEFDYYAICNSCFSLLKCEKDEIKEKMENIYIIPTTLFVDCPVCKTETKLHGIPYLIAKGMPEIAVQNYIAGRDDYFKKRRIHKNMS